MGDTNSSKFAVVIVVVSDCRYGDRDLKLCPQIKAGECYSKGMDGMCCETCAKFKNGPKGKELYLLLIDIVL